MPTQKHAAVLGLGRAVPEKVLTNFDLEKMVDTTDEWIRTRTGIERRHIAEDGTTTKTLAAAAARAAMDDAGLQATDIDILLLGTLTPEIGFPSTACLLQDELGATNAAALDFSAACSGFIYGLHFADALIRIGKARHVLVIGAETMSRITNWEDRNTCVLFGDGAGAAVVGPTEDENRCIISTEIHSNGENPEMLMRVAGGTRPVVNPEDEHVVMLGRDVFRRAVPAMGDAAEDALQKAGYTSEDLDLLVPHQANTRIIEATAKRIHLPMEKVYVNIQEYGNTSAATIPICLSEAHDSGRMKRGDLVLMVAFGAGFTWGSALMRY